MARVKSDGSRFISNSAKKRTSIGRGANTAPKGKHKKKSFKRYRGQGR